MGRGICLRRFRRLLRTVVLRADAYSRESSADAEMKMYETKAAVTHRVTAAFSLKVKMCKDMKVGVIMGSSSDWEVMSQAVEMLERLEIPFEKRVVSAHRTPHLLVEYAETAAERGIDVIIAGAGGAAHLPGMVASMTALPVIGVPVKSRALNGLDSLLSIVQMPAGVPVATVAINGAKNAALIAASILALSDSGVRERLNDFRRRQTEEVLAAEI